MLTPLLQISRGDIMSKIHPITLTESGERVFDLRCRGNEKSRFSPMQEAEFVILPEGMPNSGEILRIERVEVIEKRIISSLQFDWRVIAYVNLGIKTPSGWQNGKSIRLVVSLSSYSCPYGLSATRTHEFLDGHTWQFREDVEEYDRVNKEISNIEVENTKMEDEPNPYREGTPSYIAWKRNWLDAVEDYRIECREFEDEEEDFDPEYAERMRVVEYVSSVCDGLTGSETRNIMYDY
jgi:hypothetical protein